MIGPPWDRPLSSQINRRPGTVLPRGLAPLAHDHANGHIAKQITIRWKAGHGAASTGQRSLSRRQTQQLSRVSPYS